MKSVETRFFSDGRWLARGEAVLAPTAGLIAHGEGWFETLRVETGRPMFLAAHLERLVASISTVYGVDEAATVRRRAEACIAAMQPSFGEFQSGRLRLLLTRDEARVVPGSDSWQVLGEWSAYHPDTAAESEGIAVTIAAFAHPELGFLGKSASYHWSLAARQQAHLRGAREALLARDGYVLEGSTGALVWCNHGRWFSCDSPAILPSVTVAALRASGLVIETAALPLAMLEPATATPVSGLILVSALRLAIPIRSCDGRVLPSAVATARSWRAALLAAHSEAFR